MIVFVRGTLVLILLLALLAGGGAWLVPVETAQQWAYDRAAADPYARFEAVGAAEALWWFLRCAAPLVIGLAAVGMRFDRAVGRFVAGVWRDLVTVTRVGNGDTVASGTLALRVLLAAWFLLAVWHAGGGMWQRMKEWPVYRLRSGAEVLPNISDSNRDVIRYVAHATPPGARILALSDQKLYFLAYYLLPRRVLHPTHPESEFVIPMPNAERPLPAYQLQDLSPEDIRDLQPDFVLEYFEGKSYVDPNRLHDDLQWLEFQRMRYGPDYRPTYRVRLRPMNRVPAP